jgi:branched-chain amino acid transport system permease protein
LPGSVIGGMVLGIGVALITNYISTVLVFPSVFIVLILSLIFRPNGLMGSKRVRSA